TQHLRQNAGNTSGQLAEDTGHTEERIRGGWLCPSPVTVIVHEPRRHRESAETLFTNADGTARWGSGERAPSGNCGCSPAQGCPGTGAAEEITYRHILGSSYPN
ncbi:hypothetical protein, partial [Nocardia ninae]|uniref:hypothetical protein n=1 Tax=Nocardia ninae TaxID=356145 RepID=UPI0031CF6156